MPPTEIVTALNFGACHIVSSDCDRKGSYQFDASDNLRQTYNLKPCYCVCDVIKW